MEFKEVHKGIDTLYLSFWGDLKTGLLEELDKKKRLAQSEDPEYQAQAIKAIGNHCFEVRDKGQGYYKYILADNWFYVKISASGKKLLPTVTVRFSSELLNCYGVEYSVDQLRSLLGDHIMIIQREKVQRADIFVDFANDTDFEAISRESWVTKVDNIDKHYRAGQFTGWSIGMGGDISARLYDKTIEIVVNRKEFFKEIWLKQGWQAGQRVNRLEFELKRTYLSQLSIDTVSELMSGQNDIWRLCSQSWLRLAIDNGDENRSRWNTHSVWLNIQETRFGDGCYVGLKREVTKSRMPNEERLFINGLGYLISFAVIHGYDNLAEAAIAFLRAAGEHLDVRAIDSDKFTDSLDYVKKKMDLKKRKFNKLNDEVPF